MSIYDLAISGLQGDPVNLVDLKGKAVLIVNVASKCGLTPQYTGLEHLQERYAARGFTVLGVPCNQFGAQEPGSEAQIAEFCSLNYKVTFPMFAKVDVNGESAHPLFQHLKSERPGLLGTEGIKWNFTKFLIDRSGKVAVRILGAVTEPQLAQALDKVLGES